MGYELHIVRTRDWHEVEQKPITKSEMERIVANDPELSWSTDNSIQTPYGTLEVKGHHGILLRDKPSMSWHSGRVSNKNPSNAEIIKMIEIAALLDAIVIGDEGELYQVKTDELGNQQVVSANDA